MIISATLRLFSNKNAIGPLGIIAYCVKKTKYCSVITYGFDGGILACVYEASDHREVTLRGLYE